MKKTMVITAFFAINAFAALSVKKVLINQFIEHPALDMTTKGIIDGLEKQGYKRGVNLDLRVESSQANTPLAAQIAAKFVNQNPDVVVGVGTVSAQSFLPYAKKNKVNLVFSSVTDPLGAKLVLSLKRPAHNTSGVSNFVELEPQINLFKAIQPHLKRLGFLYNPSEVNSLSLIKKLEEVCPKLGVTLVLQAAHKTSDVPQAATCLAEKVDAIFISNDSTALSALKSIIYCANKRAIPVYVSDTDAVKLGALAALGPNQYTIGLETAHIIGRHLTSKEDLGRIPVKFPTDTALYLNENAAQKLNIKFSEKLKQLAEKIIGKPKP